MSDTAERLRKLSADMLSGDLDMCLPEGAIDPSDAADELERVRRFLSIAVDAHDDAYGEVDPEKQPRHWSVQAKRCLGGLPLATEPTDV